MKKLLVCLIIILCASYGFPQENGKVGFLFKSSSLSNVGLSFNLSDSLTLRPSFGFRSITADKAESTEFFYNSPKTRYYNASIGLFYNFLKKDHFSAYSGLEVGYIYQTYDRYFLINTTIDTYLEKTTGSNGSLILGLQYTLNKHLAVFGEIGLGFQHTTAEQDFVSNPIKIKTTIWDLSRSGFGIILYL